VRRLAAAAFVVAVASCQPITCHGTTFKEELPFPPVKYEIVSPCVYRYYGEPDEPGFPHPEIDGLAYPAFEVSTRQHLVTFTHCDPDAGMRGKIEFVYVYTHGAPPPF